MADGLVPVGDGIELTAKGLALHQHLEIDEWLDLGYTLAGLRRAFTWAIGDWLNYGEFRYGEMYAQGEAVTGLDPAYLRNLKWIASRIPLSLRRDNRGLSWHAPVASLEDEAERGRWLELADANDWTRAELRARLNGIEQIPAPTDDKQPPSSLSDFELRKLVITYVRARLWSDKELAEETWRAILEGLGGEI